jgi:aspartate--ammonia ligase
MLDRDGSRTPIQFHISNDRDKHPIDAQVVQAATKWKRMALKQFGMQPGEGLCTDMRAVRKDYFLDHDHSAYVDQWDWERVITADQRNLNSLKGSRPQDLEGDRGRRERTRRSCSRSSRTRNIPNMPENLTFLHAEEILDMYPDLPRKQRETQILQKYPGGLHHRHRLDAEGRLSARDAGRRLRRLGHRDQARKRPDTMHGLNGDILVWNPVTKRRRTS